MCCHKESALVAIGVYRAIWMEGVDKYFTILERIAERPWMRQTKYQTEQLEFWAIRNQQHEDIVANIAKYIVDCDEKTRILNEKIVFQNSDYSRPEERKKIVQTI